MTAKELQSLVINRVHKSVKDFRFSGIEKEIFEECCEKVADTKDIEQMDEDSIILLTLTSWEVAIT